MKTSSMFSKIHLGGFIFHVCIIGYFNFWFALLGFVSVIVICKNYQNLKCELEVDVNNCVTCVILETTLHLRKMACAFWMHVLLKTSIHITNKKTKGIAITRIVKILVLWSMTWKSSIAKIQNIMWILNF